MISPKDFLRFQLHNTFPSIVSKQTKIRTNFLFLSVSTLQIFTGNHREFTGKSGYRDLIFTGFFNACDYL